MSNIWLVDCVNCGQQVEISGPEDICYWCHKSARKKEVTMQENKERTSIPPKPSKRAKAGAYWDKNKEAILADYGSMPLRAFFERWHMATTTWIQLKKKWGIPNKSRGSGGKPGVEATVKEKKMIDQEVDLALTEHERYLILVGYQQATKEFLRAK